MPISGQDKQRIKELFEEYSLNKQDSIVQEIAQMSQGLVWYTIRHYFWSSTKSCDREDYFQEGCLALITAIKSWDSGKGNFEGHAITCIKWALMRLKIKESGNGIVISSSQRERFVSLRKKYLPLKAANLPMWYICEELGISRKELKDLEMYLLATCNQSLDGWANKEMVSGLFEKFEQEMEMIFSDNVADSHNRVEEIEKAIIELPISERDRLIFCKRYGLLGRKPQQLKEIAAELGVKSVHQTIYIIRKQIANISQIRLAKEWLRGKLESLPLGMRKVFVVRYGLDGLPPMGHLAIAENFRLSKKTPIQYIKEGWKILSVYPESIQMREMLWWKDV